MIWYSSEDPRTRKVSTTELKRCFDLDSIRELIRLNDDQPNEMLVSLKVSKERQSLWNFNFETSKSELTAHGSVNKNAVLQLTEKLVSKQKLDIDDLYFEFPFELGSYTGGQSLLTSCPKRHYAKSSGDSKFTC